MSLLGLIILTIIWAVYLGWYATQSKTHRRSGDSITSFRNQLATLERGGPSRGSLELLSSARESIPARLSRSGMRKASPRGVSALMDRSRRPGLDPIPGTLMGPSAKGAPARVGMPMARSASAPKLSGVRKRRRDVLVGLLAAAGFTLVFGALPPLRWLWVAHLLVDVALVAYVAVLIQIRNQSAERELKVRFLPNAARMSTVMHSEPNFTLRRTAAN